VNTLYTFGYGNRPNYDSLKRYLTEHQIRYLIDVRLKPAGWSRIWHRDSLSEFCQTLGVDYISDQSLGNTSGKADWMPPDWTLAKSSMLAIEAMLKYGPVMLMCAELDYQRCHRTDIAIGINKLIDCPILHLS
jgi:uncharacterized protein (DUF488 family)